MVAFCFCLPLPSPGLHRRRQLDRLSRHRTEAIPTLIPQKGRTPFLASAPARPTRQLVPFHSFPTPPAVSTLRLALERLISIPRILIRPPGLQRFCLTPLAQKTRPMEQP